MLHAILLNVGEVLRRGFVLYVGVSVWKGVPCCTWQAPFYVGVFCLLGGWRLLELFLLVLVINKVWFDKDLLSNIYTCCHNTIFSKQSLDRVSCELAYNKMMSYEPEKRFAHKACMRPDG